MLDNDARLIIEILTHSSKSYYEADSAEEFIRSMRRSRNPNYDTRASDLSRSPSFSFTPSETSAALAWVNTPTS
jgi:hypothetical protein